MRLLDEYCDRLAASRTLDGVGDVFRTAIAKEGYSASVCISFLMTVSGQQSRKLFRNWPQDWARLSDERKFGTRSPVLPHARRSVIPFTWTEAVQARTMTDAEREVWNTALEWGWSNGFVVPVHGPEGYFCFIGMASRERDLDLSAECRAQLNYMALLTHERCRALDACPELAGRQVALSKRELECMKWVAAGKSSWEISMILNISCATVQFHVGRARRKLGAVTRSQAIATLAVRGLV